jgi:hypothetical protein
VNKRIAAILEEVTSSGRNNDRVLKMVQPGLAGLTDGSVSTLAPIFATVFATREPYVAFLVGLAAAVGAGISMAFSEGLSDTGEMTGRGSPLLRGSITGIATFIGGIFHTLPFLIPQVTLALYVACGVVGVELIVICLIRYRYFSMSFLRSVLQVIGRRRARLRCQDTDRERLDPWRNATSWSCASLLLW